MYWRKRREKAEITTQKTMLDEKIKELHNDMIDLDSVKIFTYLAFFLGFVLLTLTDYYLFIVKRNWMFWSYIFLTAFFTFASIISIRALNKFIKKLRNARDLAIREREAEKKVQKFLEDDLTEGYYLFKNIYTGYGDIDAIVVGPTGIFLIEVKSNEGLVAKNEKGYLSVIDGDSPHKNYRDQIIKETLQVKKYIDNNVPEFRSWVNPVLAFAFGSPIKDLILDSKNDNFKIPVLNERDLLKYIYSNVQNSLTKDQVEKIATALREWQE